MRGNHGECLTEETLTEYLEGVLDPALKAASEVHLIACDDCRNQLAFLMRVLNQEMTAEEIVLNVRDIILYIFDNCLKSWERTPATDWR